ncbi:hypothetical protein N599_22320 [Saccharopolyspora erythraea D]|nr:hypothetical protein N599_22320 [Saccharopolyspora erythraea D]
MSTTPSANATRNATSDSIGTLSSEPADSAPGVSSKCLSQATRPTSATTESQR